MAKYLQGIYKPKYPKKYIGDVKSITYRSSWELAFMRKIDLNESVVEWSSEESIIPYIDVNGKLRRYFVDFKVKVKVGERTIIELIEIKPYKETIPPVLSEGKKTKTKIREVLTWDVNSRKWAAARKYCEKKGWNFRIITERELKGVGRI